MILRGHSYRLLKEIGWCQFENEKVRKLSVFSIFEDYNIDQRLAKARKAPNINAILEKILNHFGMLRCFRMFKIIATTQNESEKRVEAYLPLRK